MNTPRERFTAVLSEVVKAPRSPLADMILGKPEQQ